MSFQKCKRVLQLHCHAACCTLQVLQSTVEVAVLSTCIATVYNEEPSYEDDYVGFIFLTLSASVVRWLTALIGFCWIVDAGRHDALDPGLKPTDVYFLVRITWTICSFSYLLLSYPILAATDRLVDDLWPHWMECLAFSHVLWLLCITVTIVRTPRPESQDWPHAVRQDAGQEGIMPSSWPEFHANVDMLLADLTLRKFTVWTPSDIGELTECAICLSGEYCEGDVVRELHCHHKFHSSCFECWIRKGGQACTMRCAPSQSFASQVAGMTTV